MNRKRIEELYKLYSSTLFNDIMPFWLKHSPDSEYGGYLTWLDRDGSIISTDKSVWIQGRGLWVYSKLCNEFGAKKEWLNAARSGYDFLTNHCFDNDGRMFFQVTREGKPLRKRRYTFSEAFAVIGCAEYAKATGNNDVLRKSKETYELLLDLYRNPERLPSKMYTETRKIKSHAMPMILLATTQAIRDMDGDPSYDAVISSLIDEIFDDFVKPDKKVLLENVGPAGEYLDIPQGRLINPGHAIETSWFLLEEGRMRNDNEIIRKALNILDWSLEWGWDKEYGGILYFLDVEGKPPEQLEWDMKLWWPHNEALYALLLAYYLTHDSKYEMWYEKVHEWTFNHFPDPQYGEWYGYLHRDGTVALPIKGSMWKGLFHVPRCFILCTKLLGKMLDRKDG